MNDIISVFILMAILSVVSTVVVGFIYFKNPKIQESLKHHVITLSILIDILITILVFPGLKEYTAQIIMGIIVMTALDVVFKFKEVVK